MSEFVRQALLTVFVFIPAAFGYIAIALAIADALSTKGRARHGQ